MTDVNDRPDKEQDAESVKKSLIQRTSIALSALSLVTVLGMGIYLEGRAVVLSETGQVASEDAGDEGSISEWEAELTESDGRIILDLPEDISSEDISIASDYETSTLELELACGEEYCDRFTSLAVPSGILSALCSYNEDKGSVRISMQEDGIYESVLSLEGSRAYISLEKPGDVYNSILVIEHDEDMEAVTKRLCERLVSDGIRAYALGPGFAYKADDKATAGNDALASGRAFIEDLEPDMVLSLRKGSEDAFLYNDRIYLRGYGNDDLAVRLARDLAYERGESAARVRPMEDGSKGIWSALDVPAALGEISLVSSEQVADAETDIAAGSADDDIVDGLRRGICYAFRDLGE